MMESPDFGTLARLEETIFGARLEAIRAAIRHGGEKGRALEQAVISVLRELLPAEYGLSTGFIGYHGDGTVKLSPQFDIIIYDAARTGPLARLTACDVFPLEAVYGYVEVKATLRSSADSAEAPADNSIEHCARAGIAPGPRADDGPIPRGPARAGAVGAGPAPRARPRHGCIFRLTGFSTAV